MITLKKTDIVRPAVSMPDEITNLSNIDQITPVTHVPLIYLNRPITTGRGVFDISVLKESLGNALVIFYPLAGRLRWIGGGRVELHSNSKGALLLEAETNLKIDDLQDFRPTQEIASLVPSVDWETTPLEEIPLLLIQLTRFACGGISLGIKASHVLIDGQSLSHFIGEWAKMARGIGGQRSSTDLPFLDRSVLQARSELTIGLARPPILEHSRFNPPPLLIGHSNNLEERKKPTTVILLKLSKDQIQILKNMANEELNSSRFTRFEAVAGHIWRCASKARRHKSEQETTCYVVVDFRNRLKPPLPPKYFGNAALLLAATATAGELLSRPLGYAAGKIREAINCVTNEYVSSYLISVKNASDVSKYRQSYIVGGNKQGPFLGNPNLAITSWVGLPLHNVDFGWGKETFMGPAALGFDGKAYIIPKGDVDGSFLAPLRLQMEHASAFEKLFYEELDYDHKLSSSL